MALCLEGGQCGTRTASPVSCGWEIIRGRRLREVTGPTAVHMTLGHSNRTCPSLSSPRGTQLCQLCVDRFRLPLYLRDVPSVRPQVPVRLKISAVSTPLKWLRLAVYWIARFRHNFQPKERL